MHSRPSYSSGPDLRGEILDGRYRLEDFVACGGSGTVYAAVDLRLRRPVAAKVIHPEYARQEPQRRRIRQEALIGAQITDDHVAQIFDFGEHHARGELLPFIVMPLLRGPNLRGEYLDRPMTWATAAGWVHQLLLGLAALHVEGVIHRDVKPENCIIVREGDRRRLKIVDLGLAKVTREGLLSRPPWSVAGGVVGSLHYISPEQVLGEDVDVRADVYAAGVVLFELLTRIYPFDGTEYEILNGHVERPVPHPSTRAPEGTIPPRLDALTVRAMAKSRDDRFASALEFDGALRDVLENEGMNCESRSLRTGCGEAQVSLEAWTNFDHEGAVAAAGRASRLDRGWSPLTTLLEIAQAAVG